MSLLLSQPMTSAITCSCLQDGTSGLVMTFVKWSKDTEQGRDCGTAPWMQDTSLAGGRKGMKMKYESLGLIECDSPVLIHLCYTRSGCSYAINHSNCLHPSTLIQYFFWMKGELQKTLKSGTFMSQKGGWGRYLSVHCWWAAKAKPYINKRHCTGDVSGYTALQALQDKASPTPFHSPTVNQ